MGGDRYGGAVGGVIGVFFGLVFCGQFNGPWLDLFYTQSTDGQDVRD